VRTQWVWNEGYYYYYLSPPAQTAGRKTRLDIQNYGCNGNLLCYHGVVERNRISSLQSHRKALERLIIIKDIYIAQVRKGHKCAMSADMAVWLSCGDSKVGVCWLDGTANRLLSSHLTSSWKWDQSPCTRSHSYSPIAHSDFLSWRRPCWVGPLPPNLPGLSYAQWWALVN